MHFLILSGYIGYSRQISPRYNASPTKDRIMSFLQETHGYIFIAIMP
jgi:hypothetical protein